MAKKPIHRLIEKVSEEIEELETDRHPIFFKHQVDGRKRMIKLLLKLNNLEKKETGIYFKNQKVL